MIWPFKKRTDEAPTVDVDLEGAREGRERAEEQLRNAKAQRKEVREAVSWLRTVRERNHFAEMIGEALSGADDDRRA